LRVCLRLPAYSASAKVICFIGKLGGWGRGILPNQKVFFRVSLASWPYPCPEIDRARMKICLGKDVIVYIMISADELHPSPILEAGLHI
ncbi:hypothetical protein, partial [Pseudomonas brenneri]|uniref:hypothetical protein n=1 Tax=Pseudomonas brenneri TaxID=129817 RepID=UPI001E61EB1F